MVAKLQTLLDDVHRSHDCVMKHCRRRSGNGSARWMVPWLVDSQTVLRGTGVQKANKTMHASSGMRGTNPWVIN